jgi:anti-anti-sigma factor
MTQARATRPAEETVTVLPLSGELDLFNAADIGLRIRRAERGRPDVLVLDLRRVSFLDSTMLREIVAADVRSRREGRRIAVAADSEAVRRVFRITLLEWRLEVVDDPADVRANAG